MNLDTLPGPIRSALDMVMDPELQMSITDLGLIYEVEIDEANVKVSFTTTVTACPIAPFLAIEIEERLLALDHVQAVDVKFVTDPPWHPEMMSPEGKRRVKGGVET